MKQCLQIAQLSHRYSAARPVLSELNLDVIEGSIYGLIGPNGAGKTTTLRLILGLLRRQTGAISLFGHSLDTHRVAILRQVGSLIEGPSLYEHLTATENLEIMRLIYRVPKERIPEVLRLVGLYEARNKLAGHLSLGMKQRLAIGIAILHHPSLLILDEPTNGLDPNGIVDIRLLLKELNQQHGTTILLSTHLLSEVERLVTHLGIVHQGHLLFQGTLNDLRSRQNESARPWLSTSNDAFALQLLRRTALIPAASISGAFLSEGRICLPGLTTGQLAAINRQLVLEGIDVYALGSQQSSLETIFMEMVES